MSTDIKNRVLDVITNALCCHPNALISDDFVDDLDADSWDMLDIMVKVEDEFGIEITDDQAESLKTPKDIIDLVERKLARRSSPDEI